MRPTLSLRGLLRSRREQYIDDAQIWVKPMEQGLTQEALAEKPGLSKDMISMLERGRTRPYRSNLDRFCQALELDEAEREEVYRTWRSTTSSSPAAREPRESSRKRERPDARNGHVRDPYDVGGRPNPCLGLESYTYAQRARYAGRDGQVDVAIKLQADARSEPAVPFDAEGQPGWQRLWTGASAGVRFGGGESEGQHGCGGVITYGLLVGRVPRRANTPPARSLNPAIPESVELVLLKMLDLSCEMRCATAGKFLESSAAWPQAELTTPGTPQPSPVA